MYYLFSNTKYTSEKYEFAPSTMASIIQSSKEGKYTKDYYVIV